VILGVEFVVNVLYCTAPGKAIKVYEDRVIYLAWHDLDLVSDTLAVCKYCIPFGGNGDLFLPRPHRLKL
jgi:hypothetical protein